MTVAPYDNAITALFSFFQSLSAAFTDMIVQDLAVGKSNQEQRALDRRIRKVQHKIKKELLPGLSQAQNADMIRNEVEIEFNTPTDTAYMRNLITAQFQFELLKIPIPAIQ